MREPREPASIDGYMRPQQAWQCGLADEGPPCPLGPDGSGRCPGAGACRPVRDGERWKCNRSTLRGGPCDDGPGPDGACSVVYQCTPVRSLRTRRGRFVAGVAVAAIGAACMALSGPWRNEVIWPGRLSVHHAQLLEGQGATLRCAQCHAAADESAGEWWTRFTNGQTSDSRQSMLCVNCHGKTVEPQLAMAAHGVGVERLLGSKTEGANPSARLDDRLRDPSEPIACAACHREHQGANHNLVAMRNDACQACHRQQFDSFADDHPDFGAWPYERRTRIAFDHASHQGKHFPAEKREFSCAACHQPDATGERQLTASYAASCAECHDTGIDASLAEGLPLLSLPTIDVDALAEAGERVDAWPAAATGDFEGMLSMPAALLLAADPRLADVVAAFGPRLNLYDVDPDDGKQLDAVADLGGAIRSLVEELSDHGATTIGHRLELVLGRELARAEVEALSRRLTTETLAAFRDQFFKAAGTTASESGPSPAGNSWVNDARTLSLRYLPAGHADPWMRAWLDVAAEAASGPYASIAEPLLGAAMKPTAPGQCGSCHSVERDAAGKLTIQWRPFDSKTAPRELTRFDHGPHLIQPQMGDCASCHRIRSGVETAGYSGDDPHQFVSGFEPISKAACVACHTASAAGDGCTQCHNYHITQSRSRHSERSEESSATPDSSLRSE
jgi:predicted CXXCH cytochrome family protein